MKPVGLIATGTLLLLLGAVIPTYALQEQHDQDAKPAKQEQQAKPEKQQEAKAAKPEHQQQPKAQHEQQAKPVKQQEAKGQQGGQQHVQRTSAEEQRQHAVPALRLSARGEGRIPDDRFRSNFGESHTFVINEPVMVGGYSRFQYGGYWFGFVQPWPEGWYYTDNVYVDFIDGGYYLCNPYYPGVHLGISVVM